MSDRSLKRTIVVGQPKSCLPEGRLNFISTRRYNWLTFLPVSLLYQFRKASNCYFLFIVVLVFIPGIAPINPFASILPLVFVLFVSEVRELVEEYGSGSRDKIINNSEVNLLTGRKLCKDVQPGDVLLLKRDSKIPADIVVLTTSSLDGSVFMETANLDGETNLRLRRCLSVTQNIPLSDFSTGRGGVRLLCEEPHLDMHNFFGETVIEGSTDKVAERISVSNVLWRGCTVRNTEWVVGVVVYAGHETKMLLNIAGSCGASKTTFLDHQMNRNVIMIICFQIMLCVIGATLATVSQSNDWYFGGIRRKWSSLFFTYFVLLNALVPVSLWVSVEILKLMQSFLIEHDSSIKCNSKNMHEELGNITHIFSDKTGTLTVNKMKFVGVSVGENVFIASHEEDEQQSARLSFSGVLSPSRALIRSLTSHVHSTPLDMSNESYLLFLCLAVCHSCEQVVQEFTGDVRNQSSSPDEAALVSAAADVGIVFDGRPDAKNIRTKELSNDLSETKTYSILHEIPFTSERRMMTVVVRLNPDVVCVFTKGADSSVVSRCSSGSIGATRDRIQAFSLQGFRTLAVACKWMTFADWEQEFAQKGDNDAIFNERLESSLHLLGCTAVEDKLQEGVAETLKAVKAAGIKVCMITGDKQETAINIAMSCELISSKKNVHVMVVNDGGVGDLSEPSCEDPSRGIMGAGAFVPLAQLNEIMSEETTATSLNVSVRDYWKREQSLLELGADKSRQLPLDQENNSKFSLVIDGKNLKTILRSESLKEQLVSVLDFNQCESVVFCRTNPRQKGDIVKLLKGSTASGGTRYSSGRPISTLAIGDGANDINMINIANVGVGIFGNEGNQAANSADYAVDKFSDLHSLLFQHGRNNYNRTCTFVSVFLYKNIACCMCQLWFGTVSQFSGATVFESSYLLLFNSVFGILPLFIFGLLDKDVSHQEQKTIQKRLVDEFGENQIWKEVMLPRLYHTRTPFDFNVTALWCVLGVIHSVVIFYGVDMMWWRAMAATTQYGAPASFAMGSVLMYTCEIVLISVMTLWISHEWSKLLIWSVWICNIVVYFAFVFIYDNINIGRGAFAYAIIGETITDWAFWFILLFVTVVAVLPLVGARSIMIRINPTKWLTIAERRILAERKFDKQNDPTEFSSTINI